MRKPEKVKAKKGAAKKPPQQIATLGPISDAIKKVAAEKRGNYNASPELFAGKAKAKPIKPMFQLPATEKSLAKLPSELSMIGCELPLSVGGLQPKRAIKLKELFAVVKHNNMALCGLVSKLIKQTMIKQVDQRAFSVNRIIYVPLSKLLGTNVDVIGPLSYGSMQNLIESFGFGLQSAIGMCRRHCFRLLVINDMSHDPKMISFLSLLHYAMQRHDQGTYVRFVLSARRLQAEHPLFIPDYRAILNTKLFQVVFDVPCDNQTASNYFTYCIMHELPFVLQLNAVKDPSAWIKAEKTRLFRAIRPLIVIDKQFKLSMQTMDNALAQYVHLTKYADILIRRSGAV